MKEETTPIQRPFILEVDEAKKEITQSINNALAVHKLPCYIVEMILFNLYNQIKNGADNEIAIAKEQVKQEAE